jgi:simple sugar transport system ATP-binding protein
MVFQHFHLVPKFTVAENVALGHPATPRWIDRRQLERLVAKVADEFGLPIDPRARVFDLSVGEQQRVEILKLLYRHVRLLILDEPTAVLTPTEVKPLFETVRRIAADGRSVVFVSHKLKEVAAIADRLSVLRHGRMVAPDLPAQDLDPREIARLMVAKDEERHSLQRTARSPGRTVLRIERLNVMGNRGEAAVKDVTLSVRAGEILGVAGVSGNGQSELCEAILGTRAIDAGRLWINDVDVTESPVAQRLDRGLGYVPQDRLSEGVVAGMTLPQNLVFKMRRRPPVARGPLINQKEATRLATRLVEQFDIRGGRSGLPVSLMSGGNVQKAVLARELSAGPTVLVAHSPTRGLDVRATALIHQTLLEQRGNDIGVLLLSEDLDELGALADRLLVLYEGQIVAEFDIDAFDETSIGLAMAGHETSSL